jgi:hypothetical protein
VFTASAVAGGFEPRWGKTKDYRTGICCFSNALIFMYIYKGRSKTISKYCNFVLQRNLREIFTRLKHSVFTASAVAGGFEPRWGKTKDYRTGICCFSAKHAALMIKSKDWLASESE